MNVDLNARTADGLVRARASAPVGSRVEVSDPVAGVHGSAVVVRRLRDVVALDVDWDALRSVDA